MAQVFCPRCGTPWTPGQRFCSNCGSTLDASFSVPTSAASSGDNYPPISGQSAPPPPPPVGAFAPTTQPSPSTYYPQQPNSASGFPPSQQGYQPVVQSPPSYAMPVKDSSKSVLGQLGCGVLVVILLIVGICGGLSYAVYRYVSSASTSTQNSVATTTTLNGNNNTGITPGSTGTSQTISTTTAQINQTITFSSVDFAIGSVQEASSFTDDASPASPVIVRINLTEHNATSNTVFLDYNGQFRLILPDKSSVTPSLEKVGSAIDQAVQRTNWIDFPLTKSMAINQLTLQLGKASEAQMNVPLTGSADLSQYKLKTIMPNSTFQYGGVNWTLTSVTSSWSADGKQADSSMRYIVLTLKGDNNSSNTSYINTDYMRLKSGGVTNSSTSNTLPFPINAGVTGATGTVTFEMPQNSSAFTFIMLAQPTANPPIAQVSTDFQI